MAPERYPPIVEHPRSAGEIAALLENRLAGAGFGPPGDDPLREALVRIGARYGEILTEHLNAVPELHRAAFVSRLGGEPAPALPAEVVLTFQPVASPPPAVAATASASAATVSPPPAIVVPASTPVAAPPAPGDSEAVVFETLDDLAVMRVQAVGAFAVDPVRMAWSDLAALVAPAGFRETDLFSSAQPIERTLYLAVPGVFETPHLSRIDIDVEVEPGHPMLSGGAIEWGVLAKEGFVPLTVEGDTTRQFAQNGTVTLAPPGKWETQAVGGIQALWLACRAVPRPDALPLDADAPMPEPTRIGRLRASGRAQVDDAPVDAVSFGAMPLDPSKDFFPLGERPRFGDVFHAMSPAFAQPGARVGLAVRMTNPAGSTDGPLPAVEPAGKPRLKWEIHTAAGWSALAVDDGTDALTHDGEIGFTVPPDVAPLAIGGRPGCWLRARMMSGHYGAPRVVDGMPRTVAPSIESLRVHAAVALGPLPPRHLLRRGVLEITPIDVETESFFAPFALPDAPGALLHVGLASQERSLRGRTLSVQVEPGRASGPVVWRGPETGRDARRETQGDTRRDAPAPRWQLRCADGWRDCAVVDTSAGLTRPGIVVVHLPEEEPAPWTGSTVDPAGRLVWLRLAWPLSAGAPRLRRFAPNAVRACQTLKLDNEVLGSGSGRPAQVFGTLRTPVVGEPVLQVRESEVSGWVRWQRVPDFSASDAGARHFTLDSHSGRVTFGDGRQGRIPPADANNVRLREYRVGGGRRGNRPAGAIALLRTTVPYIDSAVNREPATGGQDGGDAQAVRQAASAWLRHRNRAVCADDYADLAAAASPEVARAYCHASRDLAGPRPEAGMAPGTVSIVIVPDSAEPRPQPTLDLLRRVKVYLDARCPVTATLVALGPDYVAVSVRARIAGMPGRSPHEMAAAARDRLQAYLHPVHGAADGRGWPPGRRPHRSDLMALLGALDGVDHVADLRLQFDEAGSGTTARDGALVCAGTVEVLA